MSKKVYLDNTGKQGVFKGIETMHFAVCSTLGPSGKTVIIKSGNELPFVTKDGVTVAKSIDSNDPLENIGMLMLRNVSIKMDDDSGDGTTSATILCYNMIKQGLEDFDNIPDVVDYKRGMQACTDDVVQFIKANALSVSTTDAECSPLLKKIAIISSNNDIELGELVARAVHAAGKYGQVALIESIKTKSEFEKEEGYIVDLGYTDATFGNDLKTGNFISEGECNLLLHSGKLTSKEEWMRIMTAFDSKKQNLIIIAQDYSTEILEFARHTNRVYGNMPQKLCLIKNGLREAEFAAIYEDLETYTGASTVTEFEDESEFGDITSVVIKAGNMILGPSKHSIDYQIGILEERLVNEKSLFIKNNIKKRLSRFQNGIIRLYVGGNSDLETKEAYDRAQDAVNACYAANEFGIIPGGGHLLFQYSKKAIAFSHENSESFVKGYENVQQSLASILKQIISNSVKTVTIEQIHAAQKVASINNGIDKEFFQIGYDFKNQKMGNLISMGVVDPAKVVINALINANSIASTVLTTDCVIVEMPN